MLTICHDPASALTKKCFCLFLQGYEGSLIKLTSKQVKAQPMLRTSVSQLLAINQATPVNDHTSWSHCKPRFRLFLCPHPSCRLATGCAKCKEQEPVFLCWQWGAGNLGMNSKVMKCPHWGLCRDHPTKEAWRCDPRPGSSP